MKKLFVRLEHCTGCHSCEMACAVAHSSSKNIFSAISEATPPRKRLFVEHFDSHPVPVLCRHCEDAPCLSSCISGALWRDDRGAVRRKKERCIGCWTCIMVCPYGVVGRQQLGGKSVALKCDLCDERESLACVEACPTKALAWAEPEEVTLRSRAEAVSSIAGGRQG
ncbi:MAG: 4Fe-4S dicluster domain-containing protein [Chloroflexi bacterium]|nr:4Fe-4S dicluster domain-containing protein [Chloroflexota bacterium]